MVVFSSPNTLSRISWQEVQKGSVLVSSKAVLNAPQKRMPAMKPPSTRAPRLNIELGRRSTVHISRANASARRQIEGCENSVAVIAAPPWAKRASEAYRYRRSRSQLALAHRAAGRDTRCKNIGAAKQMPGIAHRDRRNA